MSTSILRTLALGAALIAAADARAQTPFQPPEAPKPKILRLLAYPDYFDAGVLEAFERATGYAVAYDTYALPLEVSDKWKEGPYDVVALPGPALSARIAAGDLVKLDKKRLTQARDIQPAVTTKLAAYDPTGAYAVALGWAGHGLIYDADKAPARLGGPPNSWSALLDPRFATRLHDCGVVLPNARNAVFTAAWRLMGADPQRVKPTDIKYAAFMLGRMKPMLNGFAVADPVGALASGSACLSEGTPGEAAAANARAALAGRPPTIAFAYAREGGGVAIDALAIPRDAPHPDIAYQLIDFLLRPDNARLDAKLAGIEASRETRDLDALQKLTPLGAFDDRFAALVETEWTHLRVPPPVAKKPTKPVKPAKPVKPTKRSKRPKR